MTGTAAPVGKLVLRTFLWLPLCFAAWYVAAPFLGRVVGDVAGMLIELIRSNLVSGIEWQAPNLEFVTSLRVHSESDRVGVLVVEVNPLLYTYGLPLFVALMLAARAKAWMILAGIALLLPFQAWGVAFDLLVQVADRQRAALAA